MPLLILPAPVTTLSLPTLKVRCSHTFNYAMPFLATCVCVCVCVCVCDCHEGALSGPSVS